MPKPAITTFSSLAVNQSPTNKDNGLYAPELTQDQIDAIPADTLRNGAIVYNLTENFFQIYENDEWQSINTTTGDVKGPDVSVANNIATFSDETGKVIQDSNVNIAQVPTLLLSQRTNKKFLKAPLVTVNEIGNLGHIRFVNDVGVIFVDGLMPVEFITNDLGAESQVSSLFTGGLPSASSSPSALVELQTTTGTLLLSRLTQVEINALTLPVPGMVVYNTTTGKLSVYTATGWVPVLVADTSGNLDMGGYKIINLGTPTLSTDGANKGYVDAAVSGIPSAIVTLNGNVTGSGVVTSPITTTLNMTLDQIPIPVNSVDLNNHKIINLLDPTLAQDGATKNYVDTRTIPISQLAGYVSSSATYLRGDGVWANFNSAATALRLDQFAVPITSLNINSQKIVNLATPTLSTDGANKGYVDAAISGIPSAVITLTGGVTGSGVVTSPITTTVASVSPSAITGYSSTTSTFLRGDGTWTNILSGNLGLQNATPNAPLQFPSNNANRKIVLWEGANNDHQFNGLGINSTIFRFQVNATSNDFVFYAGTSSTTSNEVARITGTGNVGIGTSTPSFPLNIVNGSAGLITNIFTLQSPRSFTSSVNDGLQIIATVNNGGIGAHDYGSIVFRNNPSTGDGGGAIVRFNVGGNSSNLNSTSSTFLYASTGIINTVDFVQIWVGAPSSPIATFSAFSNVIISPPGSYELQSNNNINIQSGNSLKFYNSGNTQFAALKAGNLSSNITWTLPLSDGTNGQVLTTNGTGTLSWVSNASSAAKYILQTSNVSLPNAQSLGSLSTGILKNNVSAGTGVLNTAVAGTDYYAPGFPTYFIDTTVATTYNFFAGTSAGNVSTTGFANVAVGYGASQSITAANYTVSLGYQALTNLTAGAGNIGIGYLALNSNTTGSNNVGIGREVLKGNIVGSNNVGIGYLALSINNSSDNVGVGTLALRFNISGINNIALGTNALSLNSSGNNNVAIGLNSLFNNSSSSDNIAIGYSALNACTTGANNVGIGSNVLNNHIAGNNNTVIGRSAGGSFSNYFNCTLIGQGADTTVNGLTNAIAIGYNAQVSISNALILGNGCNVGIGTSTPNAPLQFSNTLANRKIVLNEVTNNDHQVVGLGTGSNAFRFQVPATTTDYIFYAGTSSTTSNELVRITGTGNVGIGTSTPNAPLQFSNGNANRKIVLWELANNDHQFNGLGITPTIFRFQVNQTTNDFVFYAGTSSTTSNEVGRITGTGTIYGRRVGGLLSSNGSGAFTPTAGALIKIPGVTTSSLLNQFTMPVNNRLLYTGNINIIIQVTLNVTMFTTTNTSTTLGVAINKNGLPITYATMYNTSTVANSLNNITASVLINMSANDYIEAFAYSSNASNINVQNMVLSIVAV